MNIFMKRNFIVYYFSLFIFLNSMSILQVQADSSFIDKIYHPYVQAHEKEIEWRFTGTNDRSDKVQDNIQKYRLAYGQSINDNWFAEIYLVGEKNRQQDFKLTATELEILWQVTEQGEYDVDIGLLFEAEHEYDINISEVSSALLLEKEWQKWVGTANLYLIYEWGNTINNELETAFAIQGRYRYSRLIEPAIEYYKSDVNEGVGPVLMGNIKLSGRKKIYWEVGIIMGLDRQTPDETLKFLIEYEF
jgi:hypothetical protein